MSSKNAREKANNTQEAFHFVNPGYVSTANAPEKTYNATDIFRGSNFYIGEFSTGEFLMGGFSATRLNSIACNSCENKKQSITEPNLLAEICNTKCRAY